MGLIGSLVHWPFQLFVLNLGWLYSLYVHLPLGFIGRQLSALLNWLSLRLALGNKMHPRKVAAVQKQVRKWHAKGSGQRMCTAGGENCQRMCLSRPKYKEDMFRVNVDSLADIVQINLEVRHAKVEPRVTVDQLQRALLPLGHTLPVVPEIGDLPIGGLVLGAGISSASIRHGLFQHICLAYEIVTPSGELVTAEKDGEHQSLFFGVPWSLGTLGFLVSVTLQIRPCAPFVRLVYQPCLSIKELGGRLQEEFSARQQGHNDFVEAVQFDRDRAVLLCAKFVDQVPKNDRKALNRIGRWYKPFFHDHVRRVLDKGTVRTEYIPLGDYLRRHWPSLFWETGRMLPLAGWFPVRWTLGWLFPPALPFPRSARVRRIFARRHILQDLMVPAKSLVDLMAFLDDQFQIYPLWLCPFTLPAQPGLLRNRHGLKSLYVNVGCFGEPKRKANGQMADGIKAIGERIARAEAQTRSAQGFQMLCADSHQSAAEFWEMFDATLYDWLRAKYDCKAALPSVYDKVCAANRQY